MQVRENRLWLMSAHPLANVVGHPLQQSIDRIGPHRIELVHGDRDRTAKQGIGRGERCDLAIQQVKSCRACCRGAIGGRRRESCQISEQTFRANRVQAAGPISAEPRHVMHNQFERPLANGPDDSTLGQMDLLLSIGLFAAFGAIFVFANLLFGSFVRPSLPNSQKSATYECGRADDRLLVGAIRFALLHRRAGLSRSSTSKSRCFYPWAVVYGDATAARATPLGMTAFPQVTIRLTALLDMLFFFGVLMVGFAYLWRFGYLDWVRSTATTSLRLPQIRHSAQHFPVSKPASTPKP